MERRASENQDIILKLCKKNFTSKEETIHRILDRAAKKFDIVIMSYPTAKLKGGVFFGKSGE